MTDRDPDVRRVPGTDDVYRVDGRLFGQSGQLAVYVVDAPKPAVIDAGTADTTPAAVLAALDALGVDLEAVAHLVPTHVHLDHAGGTGELAAACPNAAVRCHERGIDFLTDPDLLEKLKRSVEKAIGFPEPYGDPDVVPADRARPLAGGDAIDLGDRTLSVHDAPGHAPHQAAFFDGSTGVLFTADAAGMVLDGDLYPTTQPPSFDLAAAVETVQRLRELDPEVNCYPHYGVETDAVDRLEGYERMLPEWVAAVEETAERVDDPGDPIAIANELRSEWGSPGLEGDVAGVLKYLDES